MSTKGLSDFFSLPLLKKDPGEALRQSIRDNAEPILDLNRQQLDRGLDAKGKDLGRYANFNYKGRLRPVDLLLRNDFRADMFVRVGKDSTEIFSFDWKTAKLTKRYGKDIFGIATPYLHNVGEIVKPDFQRNYARQ